MLGTVSLSSAVSLSVHVEKDSETVSVYMSRFV